MKRSHGLGAAALALAVGWLVAPPGAAADEPASGDPSLASEKGPAAAEGADRARGGGVTLRRALELVERNHPKIAEARARLSQSRAQLDEAHYAPFSQFKFTGGVALAPTVRGNNVYSPNTDVSLTSSLGVAWRGGIDGVIPLWTFGKIDNLWDAAEANVALKEAEVEQQRDEVRYEVRRAFFGLLLARDGELLLADARAQLDKAEQKLQAAVDAEEGDPIDLLKLQTFAAELEVREAEAERFESIALVGLRFYTGIDDLDIVDEPLRSPRHQLGHVTRYLSAASIYRPELKQANAGLAARTAQVHLARSMLFPDLGLGMSAGVSAAPEVADQLNPFVTDPGNYFHYGAALVMQWKLDFLPQAARIRYAEAQLDEVRATQRFALGGIGAEVEQAYAEVVDWQKRVKAYEKSTKYAKQWLVRVQQGIDIGTLEEKELLEPAKAYALARFNTLNAIMEQNLALARLAKTTGWEAIAPDGT